MKDALLIELAHTWELQASTGGDGLNMLQPATRETLRQCADVLRMLVDAQSAASSPAPAVQPTEETVPWPVVASWTGEAYRTGAYGRVWLRLGDGPEETEYVPAGAVAELVEALRNGHNLLTLATAFTSRQARDQCSGTLQAMWTLIAKHGQPTVDRLRCDRSCIVTGDCSGNCINPLAGQPAQGGGAQTTGSQS